MSVSVLDDLLELDGIFAAGEFDQDGKLLAFRAQQGMELPTDIAALIALCCAKTDVHFDHIAESFSGDTEMKWTPRIGWVFAGGDYTVAASNNYGVFGKTFEVDFNDLFNALVGAR